MHIKNSRYFKSGMYDFEVEDLNDIINEFEEAENQLDRLIRQLDRTVLNELEKFGKSKTKDSIEDVYETTIENMDRIEDMCIEGSEGVRNFIDEIEGEIGAIFKKTRFNPDDICKGVSKINNKVTTAVNSINNKCTLPDGYIPQVIKRDEKKEAIRKHNKQVYKHLTNDLINENRRIIDLVEELTIISREFSNLDGIWTNRLGNNVKIDRLEYVNFRKFSEDIKSENKILSNSDLRTPKEKQKDEANSKYWHTALGVVEVGAAFVSIAFPPAGIIAIGAGVLNGAMYAFEGEVGKGLFIGVMAIPIFEGAKVATKVIGKGMTKLASKGSKVVSSAGKEVVESVKKADDIIPDKVTSKGLTESIPSSKVDVVGKKGTNGKFSNLPNGKFDIVTNDRIGSSLEMLSKGELSEKIKLYDEINDLAAKPVISILYNWQDEGYSTEDAKSDALNTTATFYSTLGKYM